MDLLIIAGVVYFAPSLIALLRKRSNRMAIFALNLFLGWTLIGWVVALVWALSTDREVVVIRERDVVDGPGSG